MRVGRSSGTVFCFVAGGDGVREHPKGFGVAGQLVSYNVRVMPFVEAKPDRQPMRVARGEFFIPGEEQPAMLRQEAAHDGHGVQLPVEEFDSFACEIGWREVEFNPLAANRHCVCVFDHMPLEVFFENPVVRARFDREEEILICRARGTMEFTAEQVQAVLERGVAERPRVGAKALENHEPVGVVAVNCEADVAGVDVSVVQHREGKFCGALIQLS